MPCRRILNVSSRPHHGNAASKLAQGALGAFALYNAGKVSRFIQSEYANNMCECKVYCFARTTLLLLFLAAAILLLAIVVVVSGGLLLFF